MKMNWLLAFVSTLALVAWVRPSSAQYYQQPYAGGPIVPASAQGQISSGSPIGVVRESEEADVQQAAILAEEPEEEKPQPPTPGMAGAAAPMPRVDGNGQCASGNCSSGCTAPSCGSTGCGAGIGGACCGNYRFFAYGEFLYLRARDNEVPYAVEIDGGIGGIPVQVQHVAIAAEDHQPGFRAGFGMAIDCDAGVGAHYTKFESQTSDRVDRQAVGNVLRVIARHPGDANAAVDVVTATATYDINYDFIDLDYRASLFDTGCSRINYVLGARYANLDQVFETRFGGNDPGLVQTNIGFDGLGIRFGFEAERQATHGLSMYWKGYGSLIGGEFRGTFFQGTNADPVIANTSFEAARLVNIWEMELGVAWTSASGMLRLSAGGVYAYWDNMLKTDEFIQAVHTNNFTNLGSSMSFDGLAARAELRF